MQILKSSFGSKVVVVVVGEMVTVREKYILSYINGSHKKTICQSNGDPMTHNEVLIVTRYDHYYYYLKHSNWLAQTF